MKHLFCFGMGVSARALAAKLQPKDWRISGTSRSEAGLQAIASLGFTAVPWGDGGLADPAVLDGVTHLVMSVPPDETGDLVVHALGGELARRAGQFDWAGYLSTTGVYGDAGGGWVDETSSLRPVSTRGERRVAAERAWRKLHEEHGLPVHLFRLAGIYGPGRNALETVRQGKARRIIKRGQVFSRIHVDDIAGVLAASIEDPSPGTAYNVCDDEAAPPQDVIMHAARLLGVEPPPEVAFEDAELSPMARSFYGENKRVSNKRIKSELGYRLKYPDYKAGLKALYNELSA